MRGLPRAARCYLAIAWAAGGIVFLFSLSAWTGERIVQFAFYLLLAVVAPAVRIGPPPAFGRMSAVSIFLLISVVSLDLPQTLIITCAGLLAQCLWNPLGKLDSSRLAFHLSRWICSGACAYLAYHSAGLGASNVPFLLLLFAASLAHFMVHTLSAAGFLKLCGRGPFWGAWREKFRWSAPHYLLSATLAGVMHLGNLQLGWQSSVLVIPAMHLVHISHRFYRRRLDEEKKHVAEMAALHLRTIEALALAIEAKDETTHDHLRRVQVYGLEIARELGVSEREVQALKTAALLHDIGKLAVPEYILSKPGRLTAEEFEKMKIHPVVGAEILECVNFPSPVVPIVRAHHEKWDGTGYPDGLRGEQIPIGARILAAVDCLDALASERPYRRALPIEQAMEIVRAEAGTSFDPRVVRILERRYLELEERASNSPVPLARLSTHTPVTRGRAPAAGLEVTAKAGRGVDEKSRDFINSIAAARQEFQMLHEVTRDLGSSLSIQETMTLLATRLKNMIPHDTLAIYVLKDRKLIPQYVSGVEAQLFSSLEIPVGHGISGWVSENKMPIVNGNPSVEAGYLNDPSRTSRLHSGISVPLEGISGVIGALTLYHGQREAFTRDHLRILMAIGSKAGLTIENALQFVQAKESAVTDQLTGLPNTRSLFLHLDQELARSKRTGAPLAVLVLDLDGFKQINDRFGHLLGNRVLQRTGEVLRSACREYDYVARMGGDEFVMVFPGLTSEALHTRCSQLCESVSVMGRRISGEDLLSLSIGEAVFPTDGSDAEQLLAVADKRMYQVKQLHSERSKHLPEFEFFPTGIAAIQ